MMKAAGPSQLLCRMPHAALPLCSARLLLKSDQKKRVLKTRRGGGSFLAWNQTFAAKFQPRSNFLQLSYKTLGRKRLGNREGSKTEGFLMERQAWPSLQQSKWVMLESSRGERSCFKAKRWNTIRQQKENLRNVLSSFLPFIYYLFISISGHSWSFIGVVLKYLSVEPLSHIIRYCHFNGGDVTWTVFFGLCFIFGNYWRHSQKFNKPKASRYQL